MIPLASGSAGLQINTFAPSTPRNAWQAAVSSGCRARHRPTAASPSHTNTRGTAAQLLQQPPPAGIQVLRLPGRHQQR